MRSSVNAKHSSLGFTLLEFLVSFAIISVSALAVVSVSQVSLNSSKQMESTLVTMNFRNRIMTHVENPASWNETLSRNEEMQCVQSGVICNQESPRPMQLFDQSGSLVYDSTDSTSGFTSSGEICNTYPSENCNFRYDLTWKPLCPPGGCVNPPILVTANFRIGDANVSQNSMMSSSNYSFQSFKGFPKNTVEKNCQAIGGTYFPYEQSCKVVAIENRCPAGEMVSGINSTGDLICRRPFSGLCALDEVAVNFNPDGSVVCEAKAVQLAPVLPPPPAPVPVVPPPAPVPVVVAVAPVVPPPPPTTTTVPPPTYATTTVLPSGGIQVVLNNGDLSTISYEDKLTDSDQDYNDFVTSFRITENYSAGGELTSIQIRYSPFLDTGGYPAKFILGFDGRIRGRDGFVSNLAGFVSQPMFEGAATIQYQLRNSLGNLIASNNNVPKDQDLILFPWTHQAVLGRYTAIVNITIADPSANTLAARGGFSITRYRSVLFVKNCVTSARYDIDLSDINPTMFGSTNMPLAFFTPTDWRPPAAMTTIFQSYPTFAEHASHMYNGTTATEPLNVREWYKNMTDATKITYDKWTAYPDACAF